MRHLLANYKPHIGALIILIVFLFGQAYCELALPQYTQNIIDVGIQNKGIEHISPKVIRADEYEDARIFMDYEASYYWTRAYEREGDKYVLKVRDEDRLDRIDEKILKPIVLTYQVGHMPIDAFRETAGSLAASFMLPADAIDDMSVAEIGEAFGVKLKSFEAEDESGKLQTYVDMRPLMKKIIEAGGMGGSALDESAGRVDELLASVGDSTLKSMGYAYAYECEAAAGVDVDANQKAYLWQSCFQMLIVAAGMMITGIIVSYIASKTGAKIGRELRTRVYKRVISYSNAELNRFQTSSLITRATNDIQQVQMVSTIMMRMVFFAPIIGLWGVVKVYQTRANMEWVIVAGIMAILIVVMILMVVALPKFKKMQKLVDNLNGVSREILTGLSVIRAFGREETEERRFDDANKELMKTMLFTNRVMTFMQPVMMLIMYSLTVLITWVASRRIDSGDLQVGAMTAFITYAMMIIFSFLVLTFVSIMLPRAGVAADRIHEVISTESTILNAEDAKVIEFPRGLVEFNNVDFKYPEAEAPVLKDISFVAEPGKTTAIIGSTGSGKSTLVSLILRFFDVTGGSVKVDGIDVRDIDLRLLRGEIGYVPQKGVLFSGTIGENIRFGAEDISDEELKSIAQISQAYDFIEEKECGFDSFVARGGNNVSGGQKQRLSIARALAKKPNILIFDDSFSALDMKTDAELRKALAVSASDATKIIVTQRVGTIMNAEQIIVLENGEIVGNGTHSDLMASCAVYRQIAESQLSVSEEEVGHA